MQSEPELQSQSHIHDKARNKAEESQLRLVLQHHLCNLDRPAALRLSQRYPAQRVPDRHTLRKNELGGWRANVPICGTVSHLAHTQHLHLQQVLQGEEAQARESRAVELRRGG